MSCWRFDLRRKLLPYIEGELCARDVERLERHLLDCGWCREMLLRLKAGHHMAQQLPHVMPGAGHRSELDAVMATAAPRASIHQARNRVRGDWLDRLSTPQVVAALTALVLMQSAFLLVSNRGFLFGQRSGGAIKASALELKDFRQLSIPELEFNTQPHIVTEGYVQGVHADAEEGTVAFKLVESDRGPGSFVVCEIMSPIHLAVPAEGSHVRVYGVARYDAQTDRKWYEVNPVLNISVLKR
jgi:hypothetical protein